MGINTACVDSGALRSKSVFCYDTLAGEKARAAGHWVPVGCTGPTTSYPSRVGNESRAFWSPGIISQSRAKEA